MDVWMMEVERKLLPTGTFIYLLPKEGFHCEVLCSVPPCEQIRHMDLTHTNCSPGLFINVLSSNPNPSFTTSVLIVTSVHWVRKSLSTHDRFMSDGTRMSITCPD